MRIRTRIGAGVAALALIGGAAMAAGGTAFAATATSPAGLTITGSVGSVETIALNTDAASPAFTPGQAANSPVFGGNGGVNPLYVEVGTNSAGYSVSVNTNGPLTSGSTTLPTGDVSAVLDSSATAQGWQPFTTDGPTGALPVSQSMPGPSGMLPAQSGTNFEWSTGSTDYFDTNVGYQIPSNEPAGNYTQSFEYNLIG